MADQPIPLDITPDRGPELASAAWLDIQPDLPASSDGPAVAVVGD